MRRGWVLTDNLVIPILYYSPILEPRSLNNRE